MDTKPQLIPKLKSLRLSGILATLDVRNQQALEADLIDPFEGGERDVLWARSGFVSSE
jgi:hypothetical protein